MRKYKLFPRSLLAALIVAGLAAPAQAKVTVTLDDPDWSFSLKQSDHGGRRGRMSREESEFIRTIQPMLDEQNYSGVIAAYNALDNDDISPPLKELMGQVMLGAQQYDKAESVLKAALEKDSGLAMAHRSLSMVYLIKQQFADAKTHVVKSIELGVTDAQLYGQLGYINLQLDKPMAAIAAYQNALMLEPDDTQWMQGLLFSLIGSDALPQARALVTEMLAKQPDNPRLWLQRSQIAMKQSEDLIAISSLETAVSLGENRSENLTSLAKLHVRSGSPTRAVALLDNNAETLLATGESEAQTYLSIANWLVANEDWQNLSRLVTSLDNVGGALNSEEQASLNVLKANVALANHQEDAARKHLAKAVKIAPANGEALISLAGLYQKQRNDERATMYYLRAETLPEYKTRAKLGRAQVAINQKQYGNALSLLREVYKANPSRSELLSNIRSLENLVNNAG